MRRRSVTSRQRCPDAGDERARGRRRVREQREVENVGDILDGDEKLQPLVALDEAGDAENPASRRALAGV